MIRGFGLALAVSLSCGPAVAAEPTSNGLLNPSAIDREVDAAVVRAVEYLANSQRPSGAWFLDLYQGEATSTTSLAMMALLAAGHVPGEEPHRAAFERGIDYLVRHQQPTGLIVDKTGHGPLYCHGISTLFLAEVVGMVEPQQSEAVRRTLERGVRAILEAQAVRKAARHAGGWRYSLQSNDSDLSVTAWQLLALRAARNAGCDVPAEAIDRAVGYVRDCASRNRGGFAYQPGGDSSPVMTAAGITAMQVCGAADQPECSSAVPFLAGRLPRPNDRYYMYGTYYASVALHQFGEDIWTDRREGLFQQILRQQRPDGSWLSDNDSEKQAGRAYCTSLAVLALTVEYGYLPIYQK
ncbi:MAG: hypothetical protein B7Z55_05870 [Planctomycetales bacterium 12-60-4]|nr:MAG: hypothetical protein B7Z55_05870 [Planctomycetales bacterium 12-60-4]